MTGGVTVPYQPVPISEVRTVLADGQATQGLGDVDLTAGRRQVERLVEPDGRRYDRIEQIVQGVEADRGRASSPRSASSGPMWRATKPSPGSARCGRRAVDDQG